jgi:hypothetical protein
MDKEGKKVEVAVDLPWASKVWRRGLWRSWLRRRRLLEQRLRFTSCATDRALPNIRMLTLRDLSPTALQVSSTTEASAVWDGSVRVRTGQVTFPRNTAFVKPRTGPCYQLKLSGEDLRCCQPCAIMARILVRGNLRGGVVIASRSLRLPEHTLFFGNDSRWILCPLPGRKVGPTCRAGLEILDGIVKMG